VLATTQKSTFLLSNIFFLPFPQVRERVSRNTHQSLPFPLGQHPTTNTATHTHTLPPTPRLALTKETMLEDLEGPLPQIKSTGGQTCHLHTKLYALIRTQVSTQCRLLYDASHFVETLVCNCGESYTPFSCRKDLHCTRKLQLLYVGDRFGPP
jgi:hypothetical protein